MSYFLIFPHISPSTVKSGCLSFIQSFEAHQLAFTCDFFIGNFFFVALPRYILRRHNNFLIVYMCSNIDFRSLKGGEAKRNQKLNLLIWREIFAYKLLTILIRSEKFSHQVFCACNESKNGNFSCF